MKKNPLTLILILGGVGAAILFTTKATDAAPAPSVREVFPDDRNPVAGVVDSVVGFFTGDSDQTLGGAIFDFFNPGADVVATAATDFRPPEPDDSIFISPAGDLDGIPLTAPGVGRVI